jgi:hypothetical protein
VIRARRNIRDGIICEWGVDGLDVLADGDGLRLETDGDVGSDGNEAVQIESSER